MRKWIATVALMASCANSPACEVVAADAGFTAYATAMPDGRPVTVEVFDAESGRGRDDGLKTLRLSALDFWSKADEASYARAAGTVREGELADAIRVTAPRGRLPLPSPGEVTCPLEGCPPPAGPRVVYVLRADRDQPLGAAVVFGEGRMGEDLAGDPVIASGPDAPTLMGLARAGGARNVIASVSSPPGYASGREAGTVAADLVAAVAACLVPR